MNKRICGILGSDTHRLRMAELTKTEEAGVDQSQIISLLDRFC